MSTLYLTRHGSIAKGIAALVIEKPELIVVIPAYNEPELKKSLTSVSIAASNYNIVIIPIINYSEGDENSVKENSEISYQEIIDWAITLQKDNVQVLPILHEFKARKSGVGAARKLGMDEAVRIYEQFDSDGVIVNLDADCTVENNYIHEIITHFNVNNNSPAAAIYFEHPCKNLLKDKAIIHYEIHLRYFIEMQRYCQLPYAYQTVGSAMAARSRAYQKQGGMNKRKAGEDFYFLQKMMLLGKFTEINLTTVFPSSRTSERVPFGTGRAMLEWEQGLGKSTHTYHPQSFVILKTFLDLLPELYIDLLESQKPKMPLLVWQFLESLDFPKKLMEIKKKSTSYSVFQRHFYSWFDGFMLMKFVHYSRDYFYPNESMEHCIKWLFENVHKQYAPDSLYESLLVMRKKDQLSDYNIGFHSF